MKQINYLERQPGDIFFSDLTSLLGTGIHDAELILHPNPPTSFIPTHAGIIGFPSSEYPDGSVVEAYLGLSGKDVFENSVAAINPWSKYAPWADKDFVQVWRTEANISDNAVHAGLSLYIEEYGPQKYGFLNLLGFEWIAIVKKLTGVDVTNPIHVSNVCSQGVAIFLGIYLSPHVSWARDMVKQVGGKNLNNLDPLGLLLMCLNDQLT